MTKTDIKLIIKAKPACRRGGWYKEKLPNCTKQALRFGGGGVNGCNGISDFKRFP